MATAAPGSEVTGPRSPRHRHGLFLRPPLPCTLPTALGSPIQEPPTASRPTSFWASAEPSGGEGAALRLGVWAGLQETG